MEIKVPHTIPTTDATPGPARSVIVTVIQALMPVKNRK